MPEYEVYLRPNRGPVSKPAVTVTQRGMLAISDAAWRELGSPEAVLVLVDRNAGRIGFRGCSTSEPDARPVRGREHMVAAAGLIREMKPGHSQSARWPLISDDGTWCIDLTQQPYPMRGGSRDG